MKIKMLALGLLPLVFAFPVLSQPALPPAIHVEPEPALDTYSDAVGATPADFRVDESGAASYSIPLYAPPGSAGVAPQLSLEYGSRHPTGPMGPGWAMGGQSAITRCKASIESGDASDLAQVPINFDNDPSNDAYCLDGQRLFNVGSGLGACPNGGGSASGQEFVPELDPATRVCGYTSGAGALGYQQWLVLGRDGSTRRYGSSDNARLAPLDGNNPSQPQHVLNWAIDRIADSLGNSIHFTYLRQNDLGQMHLAEVAYTGKITTANPLNAVQTRVPYNRIAFTYADLPAAAQRIDYVAGARLVLSRQLTAISVYGAQNNGGAPNSEVLVRRYDPFYESAAAGSRWARLVSLRECAPSVAGDVCYPATHFEWLYAGVSAAEGFASNQAGNLDYSRSLNYLVDSRLGDVNGDGRQDLVWIKDRDCPGNGGDATGPADVNRYRFMISLGTATGLGAPQSTDVFAQRTSPFGCAVLPDNPPKFSGMWHLFDFTGDGRDDLLLADNASWKIYPTASPAGAWIFQVIAQDTGIAASAQHDARLADFDGDGLPDLFHPMAGDAPGIRFLRRAPGGGILAYQFENADTPVVLQLTGPADEFIDQNIRSRRTQSTDVNGDGRTDLLVQIAINNENPALSPGPVRYVSSPATGATYRWSVLITEGINDLGQMVMSEDSVVVTPNLGDGSLNSGGVQLADLNGDGLSDVFYQDAAVPGVVTNQALFYRLNTGSDTAGQRFAPATASGLVLPVALADRLQLLDVNGDRRLDLLYQVDNGPGAGVNRYPLLTQLWRVTDPLTQAQGFAAAQNMAFDSAFSAVAQQDPMQYLSLAMDWSGDGAADLVRFRVNDSATGNYYAVKSALNFGGSDFITAFVNGLGARTEVSYGSLVYADLYTRAFDAATKHWGRDSPVFDVFGALWAVQSVRSSAPTAADASALSEVVYRYAAARIQAGGRGFLGFGKIVTEDRQALIRTSTEYRQDYPFHGRPAHTWAETFVLDEVPPPDFCVLNPDHPDCQPCGPEVCIPTGLGFLGIDPMLSDAVSDYQSQPVFNPALQQALSVVQTESTEQKFDLDTPNAFSHSIQSTFTYDPYGNLLTSEVVHSEENAFGQLVEVARETLSNSYGCRAEFSPPTLATCGPGHPANTSNERIRLGRLSFSESTQTRPGEAPVVRRSSFEYDAVSHQLISEIQGPYTDIEPNAAARALLEMRTDFLLDSNGNRTLAVQCSVAHYPNRAACLNLGGFQQRQWEATPSRFQRYRRSEYDALGRFVTVTQSPYFGPAGNGLNEAVSARIGVTAVGALDRNALGDPLRSFNAHGVETLQRYGALGRERFMRTATGAFSRSTYRWCADVVNADIPGAAPRANCPVSAVFRVMTDSTASAGAENGRAIAPRRYSYFDRLGREVLNTSRVYQANSEDPGLLSRWSSVATRFDLLGRTEATTVPYFSLNPETVQAPATRAGLPVSGIAPAQSSASFDALSRARTASLPEQVANGPSTASVSYDKLAVIATNPRNFISTTQKNAVGDTVQAIDDNGFAVDYDFEAAGNLKQVSRTPNDGSSAGVMLSSTMQYDRLGRKIAMNDPDKGSWSYQYNALGELIGQTDAKGQSQQLYYDALGRLWKRSENRLASGGLVSEPTSVWEYDTANLGPGPGKALGLLAEESNGIGGFSRSPGYDTYGRVITLTTTIDGNSFYQRQSYDGLGRPFQSFDAHPDPLSPAGTLSEYADDGFPIRTREAANGLVGQIYQELLALSPRGQVRKERLGDQASLTTVRSYDDATGRLITLNTGNSSLQRWDYTYDKHGNLTSRWNRAGTPGNLYDLQETFSYDNLDRLDQVILTRLNGLTPNTVSLDLNYDQLGNLTSKSGMGGMNYGSVAPGCLAGPQAIASAGNRSYCYDQNGNQTTKRINGVAVRNIQYTGYDLAQEIIRFEGAIQAIVRFAYAPDRSRYKRIDGVPDSDGCAANDGIFCSGYEDEVPINPVGQKITYYVGNTEHITVNGVTEIKRYIGGHLVISQIGNGAATYSYLLRDHLGSIDVITNALGVVQQRLSFDAHGTRRIADPFNAANLWGLLSSAQAATFNTATTTRGFTGHEQIDQTGLVHMNGRIYDPELGRFIQADPLTDAHATQGLNRYSYVLNNPLSATDPSGYLSFRQVLGIAVGVAFAVISQQYWAINSLAASFGTAVAGGFVSAYIATGSVQAGLWGALSAAVFWGIGTGFSKSVASPVEGSGNFVQANFSRVGTGNLGAKIAAHGAAGGTLSVLQGGKFGHGFVSAGATQAISPAIAGAGGSGPKGIATRAVLSAAVGGTVSKITGGKFASGAATSAFASLFNDSVHEATNQPRDARNWKFDKGDPNYHFHRFTDELCNVDSVCTLESASLANRMHPAPGNFANKTPVVDGQYGVAQLGYPIELDNFGPVVHSVSADGLTVRNSTVEGHLLHPGYVERTVFENGGKIYIRTVGEGVGALGSINNALSKPMWSGLVNSHVRYEISLGYRK